MKEVLRKLEELSHDYLLDYDKMLRMPAMFSKEDSNSLKDTRRGINIAIKLIKGV